jgi:preprotein translocase subunit SecG
VFFLTSLGLAYLATNKPKAGGGTVMDAVKTAPAKPGAEALKPPAAQPVPDAPGSKARDVPQ